MEFKIYLISIFLVLFNSLSEGKPSSSFSKTLPKSSAAKAVSTASLEPCKIYSLPPNYQENCTKDGGVYTSTHSMGLCGNNEPCKCSYFTCLNKIAKATKTTPRVNTKSATLEQCKIYSLPPNFRENCTKEGGVVTETHSMGYCDNKECKCPYMTCVKTSAKTTPRMTTKVLTTKSLPTTLPPCMTYSLPPYFRENCTKSGGRVTQTHSKAYCDNKEPCDCPYYTCVADSGNPRTASDTTNTVAPTTLPPCLTYSLPPYFREDCTKSGGIVTETYSMAYCRNNEVCQCPYYTCLGNDNCSQVTVTVKDKETVTEKETITITKTLESEATNGATTQCVEKWGQCGGVGYSGPSCCESGSKCREINKYFSQCM